MIKLLAVAAAFFLLPLSVAAAQVTVQTDQPVAGDAATAALAEVQAAGLALTPIFDALEVEAAVIRADTTLSAEQKEASVMALIAPHRPVFDRLGNALAVFIEIQAQSEGASPEQAAVAAGQMRTELIQGIVQGLVTGEADQGDE